MKLNCNLSICDRLLPSQNMLSKHKSIHALISIGRKPSLSDSSTHDMLLMVCTAKNRAGDKYILKDNILQIFNRFQHEGKLTIRFKKPEHDLILCKCDPLELKCFCTVLKSAALGLEVKKEQLSTLVPASSKDVIKPQTKMTISNKKDYPLTSGFPKSLETLTINTCNLKRFDSRIVNLKNLTNLDLSRNVLSEAPRELSNLRLKTLNLADNQIQKIDVKFLDSELRSSLQVLDLSNNSLEFLPGSVTLAKSLVRFKVNNNSLKCLPYGLATIASLKFLQAADNEIRRLPADFMKANLDELDLYGNPFDYDPIRGTSRLNLPTLVELAARAVKSWKLPYNELTLPRTLMFYLNQGRVCLCGTYCFQTFGRVSVNLDLRRIAQSVVKLQNYGYVVDLDGYLCSWKCFRRFGKNPSAFWRK